MRLNDFGKEARMLRMRYDMPLKTMAEAMGISSAHLSALEYGDKKLNTNHINAAIRFFQSIGAEQSEIANLQEAGDSSMLSINIESMNSDARSLVVAFARSLQDGNRPSQEIIDYIRNNKEKP